MKALKVTAILIAMIIAGMTGMFLLFSENENLFLFLLSKPAGIGLLGLSYLLQNELKRVSIYNNH